MHPQQRYSMSHGIYSLGVVLLELGLWRPLASSGLAKLRGTLAEDVIRGKVRDYLGKLAAERLPAIMGTKYSDIMLFCLDIDGEGQMSKRRSSTRVSPVARRPWFRSRCVARRIRMCGLGP